MKHTLPQRRTLIALILVGCLLLAGCSGWGDGNSDDNDNMEEDESDDLEDADEDADSDESGSDTDSSTDEEGGDESTEEYASPDSIQVDNVTHMESEANTDHDEITLINTDEKLALPIGGWEIEIEGHDQRIPIEDDTMIEPGATHTVQFEEGEKVLNEDGGVINLYDADGNLVGSWDYMGSPSAPPTDDDTSENDELGYVQFQIVDVETGEGIEDAEVALTGESDETYDGTTDGAGVTTVRNIPYGEYDLTITHEEYAEHSETITVDEEGSEITIELESAEGASATQQLPTTVIA